VRSEVQVFPGPPPYALSRCGWQAIRQAVRGPCPLKPSAKGGVAQLGERVLCKHEVVGSIPSASTTLALLELRVAGHPDEGWGSAHSSLEIEFGIRPLAGFWCCLTEWIGIFVVRGFWACRRLALAGRVLAGLGGTLTGS
jgi:hypothetical protein